MSGLIMAEPGLPGANGSRNHQPAPAPRELHQVPARPRVMVVDDDDSVRETLADLLEMEGFEPVSASSAEAALHILSGCAVDVLVTDLSMPGADGITLIRQARCLHKTLPAILLTGYAEQETAVSIMAGGHFHVLRKPVEVTHLIRQIDLLLSAELRR